MDDPFDYHSDIYAWSQQQASVLRRLAERPDLPNELDLEHVAEEIEDVGNSQLAAVESFIRQIFVHLIKAVSVPQAPSGEHWRDEIAAFYGELSARYTPSMAQWLDLQLIWRRAIKQARVSLDAHEEALSPSVPAECPFSLSDLITDDFDIRELMKRLAPPEPANEEGRR